MESNGDNKDYDMDSELIKSALVCQDKQVGYRANSGLIALCGCSMFIYSCKAELAICFKQHGSGGYPLSRQ